MNKFLIFVPVFILCAAGPYFIYEPGKEKKEYIVAEIISYSKGFSLTATDSPSYSAVLSNGLRISVPNWGELRTNYRGTVVLEVTRGQLTNRPRYKIDKEHNKHIYIN